MLERLQALRAFVQFWRWGETRLCAARYHDRSNRACADSWEQFTTAIKFGKKLRWVHFRVFQQNRSTCDFRDGLSVGKARTDSVAPTISHRNVRCMRYAIAVHCPRTDRRPSARPSRNYNRRGYELSNTRST